MLHRFQTFVTGITTCYRCIQKIKSTEMTEFGLKGTHVMCLFFLHHSEEALTAAQLSQLCCEDKAAISRTVGTLQEKGLVEAGEQKYRTPLLLTASGTALAEKIDVLIEQWVCAGSDQLSEEERSTFYHALELIAENLRQNISK